MEPRPSQNESASTPAGLEARLGAHTHVGQVRGDNEDRLVVFDLGAGRALPGDVTHVIGMRPASLLMMVADGMGGMSGGEQASQMCAEIVPAEFQKRLGLCADGPSAVQKALGEAIVEANRRILARAKADAKLQGMGCTLTAVLLEANAALIAQVGDSRAYLGREGEVTQLTRDQTVWESLRAQGKDPEKALGSSQFKSMLLQAVGAQENVEPAFTTMELCPGDWLVICSDGLYRVVEAYEIGQVLSAPSDPAEKARALTALANRNGGPDNVSVIVCHVAGTTRQELDASAAA